MRFLNNFCFLGLGRRLGFCGRGLRARIFRRQFGMGRGQLAKLEALGAIEDKDKLELLQKEKEVLLERLKAIEAEIDRIKKEK